MTDFVLGVIAGLVAYWGFQDLLGGVGGPADDAAPLAARPADEERGDR